MIYGKNNHDMAACWPNSYLYFRSLPYMVSLLAMLVEIFADMRTNGKLAIRIGDWVDNGQTWKYVESIMPEGNCADWAEKFWDAAFVTIHTKAIAKAEGK